MDTDRKAVVPFRERMGLTECANFSAQDEVQLIKASQQGNQEAFAMLVQLHQRSVFNLGLHLVHDYDEASEIAQEAFVFAWQELPSFHGELRFSMWLYRITYHCGLRWIEQRKRETTLQEALQAEC